MSKLIHEENINLDELSLEPAFLGYSIRINGKYAGSIEGQPGMLEYIEVEMHLEGNGIAQRAIQELIKISKNHGCKKLRTNNDTHPAMTHILKKQGFEETDFGWEKEI